MQGLTTVTVSLSVDCQWTARTDNSGSGLQGLTTVAVPVVGTSGPTDQRVLAALGLPSNPSWVQAAPVGRSATATGIRANVVERADEFPT